MGISVLLFAVVAAGCGKKGPPLTPIVRVPATVTLGAPQRVGDDVYLPLTVPMQNIDASTPASIARIEIYAATALTPPARARMLEIATRVAVVPVAPAADPADPAAVVPLPAPEDAAQGAAIVVRDTIEADDLTPRALPPVAQEQRRPPAGVVAVEPVRALRRFYMAVPYSERGRSGPPSAIVELPLIAPPAPPTAVTLATNDLAVNVAWAPSGGLIGWLTDQALPRELAPFPEPVRPPAAALSTPAVITELPAGPTLYNVYRELSPDPLLLPAQTADRVWLAASPRPLNVAPLPGLTFSDPLELDDRQRCYHVRAVRGTFESAPSERVCFVPADLESPAAPTGVQAIAAEGVINVFWEPNGEADLGGYLVLRRGPSDDTLLALTPTPIAETRFADRNVMAGVRYEYEVRAVDMRIPLPNVSAGTTASETAR